MKQSTLRYGAGFTLIELIVVISIISLLASIVLASIKTAQLKALDARKIADFRSMSTALALFHERYGRYPYNYLKWNGVSQSNGIFDPVPNNGQNEGACDAPVPGAPGADPALNQINNLEANGASRAYDASMQELVSAGYLGSIPHHPPGAPGYCYYNHSSSPEYGAILMTSLQTGTPSYSGPYNSCRFPGAGWCDPNSPSLSYCVCNPE